MRRTVLSAVLVLGLAAVAAAQSVTGDRPECVEASASSRWNAAGYNHSVTIRNGCSYTVHCTVSTDVNPSPQTVDVEPSAERFVTTYLDAPGAGFVASVACRQ